jgi:hypothetical protein
VTVPSPSVSGSTGSSTSSGSSAATSSGSTSVASSVAKTAEKVAEKVAEAVIDWMPTQTATVAGFRAFESGDVINMPGIPSNFDVARVRAAESGVTIVVQAPSAIDEEGFTRAVVNAMNQTQARTGGGGSQLVL